DGCRASNWHFNVHGEVTVRLLPFNTSSTVGRFVSVRCVRHIPRGLGFEDNMAVARLLGIGVHSCQHTIKPNDATSEHGMVARTCPIPLLPCGCCTLFDPPSVAGLCFFVHGFKGEVVQPVLRQDFKEKLRTEYPCVEVTPVGCDV